VREHRDSPRTTGRIARERRHLTGAEQTSPARPGTLAQKRVALPGVRAATQTIEIDADLRRAIARLEEANCRKDDLFATLAHEMRAPLHALITWIQVLRETADPTMKQKALASMERSLNLQARMIDNLLDASKISAGKLFLELHEVDLAAILRDAIDMLLTEATGKGIEMELVGEPDFIPMRADLTRLQQVVVNILSNAIKFTPRGGKVKVDVAVAGERAEIRIMDTGEGISPELLPHIFERYRQGDGSAEHCATGLGLGLTIAGHLVELHGGRIEAESPGKGLGATFRVQLPLEPTSREATSPLAPAVKS
jgi:signal transduction histidine kinase